MNINVNIKQLILDGINLPPRQRPLLQAAVEAELGRLLADGGLAPGWQTGGAVAYLAGGAIQLADSNDPTVLGQQIARAVYGGISR